MQHLQPFTSPWQLRDTVLQVSPNRVTKTHVELIQIATEGDVSPGRSSYLPPAGWEWLRVTLLASRASPPADFYRLQMTALGQ